MFFLCFQARPTPEFKPTNGLQQKTTFSSIKIVALIGIYIDKVFFIKKPEIMTMASAHGAMRLILPRNTYIREWLSAVDLLLNK